jgi:outer membrane protein assembly factor BamB
MALAHPMSETPYPDLTPVPSLGGYPVVQYSAGLVLADDLMNPFIAGLKPSFAPNWHNDILNRLGVPSVQSDVLFTNVGGDGALGTLCALDPNTGQKKWSYAPAGFPSETTKTVTTVTQRSLPAAVAAVIGGRYGDTQIKGSSIKQGDSGSRSVPFVQDTMALEGEHGYWTNPGVVTTKGNVYGQVGTKIVALDQGSGKLKWEFALENGESAHSIAATSTHLFVSLRTRLIALDLTTGKLAWKEVTERGGTLSIGDDMVFLAIGSLDPGDLDGGQLIAFATDPNPTTETPSEPPPHRSAQALSHMHRRKAFCIAATAIARAGMANG